MVYFGILPMEICYTLYISPPPPVLRPVLCRSVSIVTKSSLLTAMVVKTVTLILMRCLILRGARGGGGSFGKYSPQTHFITVLVVFNCFITLIVAILCNISAMYLKYWSGTECTIIEHFTFKTYFSLLEGYILRLFIEKLIKISIFKNRSRFR